MVCPAYENTLITITAKVSSLPTCLYYYKFSCPSSQGAVLASYDPLAYSACTNLQWYYTRPWLLPIKPLINATINVRDTRNTVSPHRHFLRIFFCTPFPWNTDRTLPFTENTDICCYKKELLRLLVFLICSEINKPNDFQDFRLCMGRFQQFLTWYDSYCVVRHLLVPKSKQTRSLKKT